MWNLNLKELISYVDSYEKNKCYAVSAKDCLQIDCDTAWNN